MRPAGTVSYPYSYQHMRPCRDTGIKDTLICPYAVPRRSSKYGCARVQFGRGAGESDFQAAGEAGLICNLFYSDDAREAMSCFNKGVDVILALRAPAYFSRHSGQAGLQLRTSPLSSTFQ